MARRRQLTARRGLVWPTAGRHGDAGLLVNLTTLVGTSCWWSEHVLLKVRHLEDFASSGGFGQIVVAFYQPVVKPYGMSGILPVTTNEIWRFSTSSCGEQALPAHLLVLVNRALIACPVYWNLALDDVSSVVRAATARAFVQFGASCVVL